MILLLRLLILMIMLEFSVILLVFQRVKTWRLIMLTLLVVYLIVLSLIRSYDECAVEVEKLMNHN